QKFKPQTVDACESWYSLSLPAGITLRLRCVWLHFRSSWEDQRQDQRIMAEAAVRKLDDAREQKDALYREAPHNIEAEQALLGAILINNDAFYRVSDFLKPTHFFEPLHRRIYEISTDLIRVGKMANPVTMKTFLPNEGKIGDLTVFQYVARLATEA